ncbi:hypothetical protein [Pseudoalteromonas sp. PPB1]|uniref:hypothetical protein n=1 Tax=Pseudoalteromonas sp. PPB1 TaxID=2756136 RepID=UPI00189127D1|nr:hypothetical protein [Pseudoalteromonas sp. PPB1]
MEEEPKELDPIEEIKIVQDIIITQEQFCFKVFSWAAGFITALTLGLFHNSVSIPYFLYIACGLTIVFGFYIVGRHHWHTFSSAIERSRQIESAINAGSYNSFKLNHVLERKHRHPEWENTDTQGKTQTPRGKHRHPGENTDTQGKTQTPGKHRHPALSVFVIGPQLMNVVALSRKKTQKTQTPSVVCVCYRSSTNEGENTDTQRENTDTQRCLCLL